MGEVAARLELGDAHVIFGHTHRAGPLAGDDERGVARAGAARGWSTPAAGPTTRSSSRRPGRRTPTGPGGAVLVEDGPAPPPRALRLLGRAARGGARAGSAQP